MFRDCGKKTGIIEKCAADSKTTFEVFEERKKTMRIEEVVYFPNTFTNPGFIINRLSTYLDKAVIPEYFIFHFIYVKGCFRMKLLPDSYNALIKRRKISQTQQFKVVITLKQERASKLCKQRIDESTPVTILQ